MTYNSRDEIKESNKWDLSTRFKTDQEWEEKLKETTSLIDKFKIDKDIIKTLDKQSNIAILVEKLFVYARSKHDENLEDNKYNLYMSKIYSLYNEFLKKSSSIRPTILKLSEKEIKDLISSSNKYKLYLTNLLRSKKHTLSETEEKLISSLTSENYVNEDISNVMTNSVIKFEDIDKNTPLLNSTYRKLITDKNRNVRKKAFFNLTNKLKEYESIYGLNLISSMKRVKTLSSIYNFNTVLEMDLFESNINKKVYDNLYNVVESRLDVYQKYFDMIKKTLKLDKLEYYDKAAELSTYNKEFSKEEAKDILLSSLSILGSDYTNIIKKAFDDRWIDFGVYKGKTSSIYATVNYGDAPLINANFQGKFSDISTLAHELGHAAHFYLSKDNHYHEAFPDLFTAEVASLTNEILLSNYITENSEDINLKKVALENILSTISNNLFDATLEGKLEHQIYSSKEELTSNDISKMLYNIKKEYYGDKVSLNDNISIMWSRRGHYFSPYYLYKYATGIISAIYIASKIINKSDNMLELYLEFLTKGSSNYPEILLKMMNINLEDPNVINEAISYFEDLIDKYNSIEKENTDE